MSWEVNREKRKRMRDDGKRKEKKRGFKPPIFNYSFFFTGIANRSPFGEERGILLIAASTGIMRLVPGLFHKE